MRGKSKKYKPKKNYGLVGCEVRLTFLDHVHGVNVTEPQRARIRGLVRAESKDALMVATWEIEDEEMRSGNEEVCAILKSTLLEEPKVLK